MRYAIADVAALVAPGGAIDARGPRARRHDLHARPARAAPSPRRSARARQPAARRRPARAAVDHRPRRGRRAGARPPGAGDRPQPAGAELRRGAGGDRRRRAGDPTLRLLREVGLLRLAREAARGGVSLTVPVQEVVREGDGYDLRYERDPRRSRTGTRRSRSSPGSCAADDHGRGRPRALPGARPGRGRSDLESLRRSALALGVAWPEGAAYGDVVRALDGGRPGRTWPSRSGPPGSSTAPVTPSGGARTADSAGARGHRRPSTPTSRPPAASGRPLRQRDRARALRGRRRRRPG